ncbi:MAG: sterol desaturase family protein [Pseudohongiella sp.]|nr:sterol desaturase family protein [Pseudohongiella sp.]
MPLSHFAPKGALALKALLARAALVLAVLFSLGVFLVAREAGLNLEVAVLAAAVMTLLAALVLERYMPFRQSWNRSTGDTGVDLTSAAALLGVVEPLLKYGAPLAVVYLYGLLPVLEAGREAWTAVPFVVQLVAATAMIEFGRYWSHRLHHTHEALWWLHAMHHSSERLYTLNNFRFHPLNYVINFGIGVLPVMLLGVPADVLLGYLAISQLVLMLQHANVDLRSGWANYLFSTNELHRWHHSTVMSEANNNYGNAFVLWDMVFGTFKYEPQANEPQRIGLFSSSSGYPGTSSYLHQLRSLFTPACCRA